MTRSKDFGNRSRTGRVVVTRVIGSVEFPARFTLVAAMAQAAGVTDMGI